MPIFKADLHIHSCLSPCGDLEMSPSAIASRAKKIGLDIIALADHNTALNTPAFYTCCKKEGILGLCGIEVTSLEEAHLLCLFETPKEAVPFGEKIYQSLPPFQNIPEKFGDQIYVDEEENIEGELDNYLTGGGSTYSIDEIQQMTKEAGGIFIPAHVDKPVFSITSQLGFIPEKTFSTLEITRLGTNYSCPTIMSSDAHYLDDIGHRYTIITTEIASFEGLKQALSLGTIEPIPQSILTKNKS